jgi:hypothetical protein
MNQASFRVELIAMEQLTPGSVEARTGMDSSASTRRPR